MKFKGFLTDNGVYLLEKRILHALEKTGKIWHIYITETHLSFLHNLLNGDGIQSVAQFRKQALFDEYRFSSQNDAIAFSIDLSLLQRALRSIIATAGTDDGNKYEMKLVKKLAPHSHQALPFLTFETQGYKSAVIQDVPISKPLSRPDLLELQTALQTAQVIPTCLVQLSDMNQLQSFVDRMKHVGDALNVSISKYGDLHLQISTTLITLGAEFRKLLVLGEKADMPVGDGDSTAQTRMQRAVLRGDATSVQVSVKHFFKSLQCHLAKPDCAYFGIVNQGSCLTVIFDFFIPGTRLRDNAISLYCRLPVLDPGSS
ncbi:DNA metabolism protein [Lithospermum erythrorhizon]|uniref:Checkpoint protein n=1 Tax=Lithospermum erythrorhizon TaxID=34254 RepID=A0AAV3R529_LITER